MAIIRPWGHIQYKYIYYAFYIQPQNTGKSGVLGKNQFRSGYGSDLACSDPDPNGDIQKLSFLKNAAFNF